MEGEQEDGMKEEGSVEGEQEDGMKEEDRVQGVDGKNW